ncbi:Disks large 1 tumor suppressor protein [Harpegnathos saltator]|uniref:Disks large 1 tumor suppressor protein n=1 Tax=Harpegnathos saltator TaxID=610380 RepID=E2C7J5_HARSA|nr:Disks large 1 tumor suppressor protein [Harpegnathos saltator]
MLPIREGQISPDAGAISDEMHTLIQCKGQNGEVSAGNLRLEPSKGEYRSPPACPPTRPTDRPTDGPKKKKPVTYRAFLANASHPQTLEIPSPPNTLFTLDTPGAAGPAGSYCEVHGYVQAKEDIQEFYELTLLDESKSVQQKTAETIRIADKWEASDGPITPTFAQNEDGPASALPLTQTLSNIYSRRSASPDVPGPVDETQKTYEKRYDNAGAEEQLPPPPSPPQLKEAAQLDGVPRPNSVDRILHPDGTQHIGHEALNKKAHHPKKLVRFDSIVDTFSISDSNAAISQRVSLQATLFVLRGIPPEPWL